jgi:putative membrane protein
MIANYTNHAANERTFLAWIRMGLAVAAFGFFLIKLNVIVDAVGGGSIPHLPAEEGAAGPNIESDLKRPITLNLFLIDLAAVKLHVDWTWRDSMIANYTNHAANERTFLAWIRTGLAVAAFGFFLIKLNVFVDAVGGGGSTSHLAAEDAHAVVAVATRYAGLAMVAIGGAIIARSSFAFERTRRAIDRDEIIQIPQSRAESLLSAALAIAVLIFCINLARI